MTDHTGPHWESSALVLIDVQNDFLDGGSSPVPGTTAALGEMAVVLEAFRAAGRPIAHVLRLYEPGGSDVDLPRRASIESGASVVAPGTWGSQVPASLKQTSWDLDVETLLAGRPQQVDDNEVVLYKPRWSAFHRTGLDEWLQGLGLDTLVVAGCNLPNCPRATLFEASARDYRSVLVGDGVSQVSDERLGDLRSIGVTILRADEVAEAVLATVRQPDAATPRT